MPIVPVPIVGPAYRARSKSINAQRCINFYLEMGGPEGKTPIALLGMPGLTRKMLMPNAPAEIRGVRVFRQVVGQPETLWVVSGNKLYEVSPSFVATERGTLLTSSGPVSMRTNATQVMIVDGFKGYIWDRPSVTFGIITDEEFPNGARLVDYIDSYFLVEAPDSDQFVISKLGDGRQWNGLDFTSAEGSPDNIVSHWVDRRQAFIFGERTIEVYTNTGDAAFPLTRLNNVFIQVGCAAPFSPASIDNSVMWIGQDELGNGVVYRMQDYNPQRVSDHALEYALSTYERIDDARSFAYQQEGHAFYQLTFPTAGKTWVYDASIGEWYEKAYRDPSTGELRRHRSNCHAFFAGLHVVGDFENGKLYALDMNNFTDDGEILLALRASATMSSQQQKLFFSMLEVNVESGVGLNDGQGKDPQLMMRLSYDNGNTWSNTRKASMGKIGEYTKRVRFPRCGAGRNLVIEVSISDPVRRCITGAQAIATKGSQ